MSDFFNEDGHLTNKAFSCLMHGQTSELERLEIAEHLSFCDECLMTYTNLLDKCELMEVENSVSPGVRNAIKNRARKIFLNKYATAAVAACLAIALFSGGAFEADYANRQDKAFRQIVEIADQFTLSVTDRLNNFILDWDAWKGVSVYGK